MKQGESTQQRVHDILLALFVLVASLVFCYIFGVLFVVIFLPFFGFDFTSAMDFVPGGLIVTSLIGLAVRHAKRPYPEAWLRFARGSAYVLTVLPPVLLLAGLYLLSWYGFRATNHWPQPMMNDPKLLAPNDAAYQKIFVVMEYVEAFATAFVWVWAALLLHLRRYLTRQTGVALFCLFLTAWLLFAIEPGRRFEWWID